MQTEPRRGIARLIAGAIIADGRVAVRERECLPGLERLGLGQLSALVEEEIQRAVYQPLELEDACRGLMHVGPQGAAIIMAVLCELVTSDGDLAAPEVEYIQAVGRRIGLAEEDLMHILNGSRPTDHCTSTEAAPPVTTPAILARGATHPDQPRWSACPATPEVHRAYGLLGVDAHATAAEIDAAFLTAVDSYNPAKLMSLGADFVVLAVRRLEKLTAAYELARSMVANSTAAPPAPSFQTAAQ